MPEEYAANDLADGIVNEHTGKDGAPIDTRATFDFSNLTREERAVVKDLCRKRLAANSNADADDDEDLEGQ